jgi:hypothetical protein
VYDCADQEGHDKADDGDDDPADDVDVCHEYSFCINV